MNIDHDIAAKLKALEGDIRLLEPDKLEERLEALDMIEWIASTTQQVGREPAPAMERRLQASRTMLEEANRRLFRSWRAKLRDGRLTAGALRRAMGSYTAYSHGMRGYLHLRNEALDALLAGILRIGPFPSPSLQAEPEMVHLEFTPTSVILELVDTVPLGPQDVFVDLGCGLGQVAILARLLTGVPTRGIDVEPAYVAFAQSRAQELGLAKVTFECLDARQADYSLGTVFYLFTPFTGAMLDSVLTRLQEQASERAIVVCSYGPCTPQIAQQPWLRSIDEHSVHEFGLAIFRSRHRSQGIET